MTKIEWENLPNLQGTRIVTNFSSFSDFLTRIRMFTAPILFFSSEITHKTESVHHGLMRHNLCGITNFSISIPNRFVFNFYLQVESFCFLLAWIGCLLVVPRSLALELLYQFGFWKVELMFIAMTMLMQG